MVMEEKPEKEETIPANPAILYPYTSKEGLLGILKDKCLRCTSIFYLNDSTELEYAQKLILDELNARIPSHNSELPRAYAHLTLEPIEEGKEQIALKKIRTMIEDVEVDNFFIFS